MSQTELEPEGRVRGSPWTSGEAGARHSSRNMGLRNGRWADEGPGGPRGPRSGCCRERLLQGGKAEGRSDPSPQPERPAHPQA